MERVFRALGDPRRRLLLDELFRRDGQTVTELDAALPGVTRFATMKHLRVLAAADLVVARRVGREKRHFLNPVPIRLVHDRWIRKYAEPIVAAMSDLKRDLEERTMKEANGTRAEGRLEHVYQVIIQTSPEALWKAITDPRETMKYFYESRVETSWKPGEPIRYLLPDDSVAIEGTVLECDPPRRFAHTWHALWDEKMRAEAPSMVTWEITRVGSACRLTVTHRGLGEEAHRQVSGGIVYIVSGLKSLLETGHGLTGVEMRSA